MKIEKKGLIHKWLNCKINKKNIFFKSWLRYYFQLYSENIDYIHACKMEIRNQVA